jgi:hypothetical protein
VEKPKPCPECPKYKTCTALCPEVEEWVSQDNIELDRGTYQASRPAYSMSNSLGPDASEGETSDDMIDILSGTTPKHVLVEVESNRWDSWEKLQGLRMSKKLEEFAWLYYWEGKRIKDIAAIIGKSSKTIDKRHQLLKRHVASRLNRLEVWRLIDSGAYRVENEISMMILRKYFKELYGINEIRNAFNLQHSQVNSVVTKCLDFMEKRYGIEVGGTSLRKR